MLSFVLIEFDYFALTRRVSPFFFQNAWQTECPEEMVEYVYLLIPRGADVDNPIEDAALMARIGAHRICGFATWFELKNTATGTRFTFAWHNSDSAAFPESLFSLRRNDWLMRERTKYECIYYVAPDLEYRPILKRASSDLERRRKYIQRTFGCQPNWWLISIGNAYKGNPPRCPWNFRTKLRGWVDHIWVLL